MIYIYEMTKIPIFCVHQPEIFILVFYRHPFQFPINALVKYHTT